MLSEILVSDGRFDRKGDHVVDRDGRDILMIARNEGFMVNSVAERLGMTVRDFEVALDRVVGMNPKNFFRQYRAVLARRMISEGQDLHDIAKNLGFRHYSHFSTEIKGYYGIPPLRLKKLIYKRCGDQIETR